ncbi:hypothetical protein ABT095_18570 [Kitasatospora sp. NPDC002227]|uniref:hypothetical protein n=1 Tax=Kitasatospora sp. NPDC002227 TaxID=3154773 RepID=UPI0033250DDD
MQPRSRPLRSLGFLTEGQPTEAALRLVELGERLGLDTAWVGGGDLTVLTEAARRTGRITLGVAGLPSGSHDELAALDRRCGARFHLGVAVSEAAVAGLDRRVWCVADGPRSAGRAGERGLNLLAEAGDGRLEQIRAFRERHPDGAWARVCQRLALLPTDSATAAQRARYAALSGLAGPAAELAERLRADAAFREVEEMAVVLPDGLPAEDHAQLLADLAGRLGPALGWTPAV